MGGPGLKRIELKSLKAQVVEELERLVISGELGIGAAFPPERELARQLGVSRPIVHEAMVELAAKGFARVEPRRGAKVADYYREGTLAIFESIVLRGDGFFPVEVLEDLVAFRRLIEVEAVRLAAERGGGELMRELEEIVAAEETLLAELADAASAARRTELDVRFHILLAEASGNRILPLVMRSVEPVYYKLVARFYAARPDVAKVVAYHRSLLAAVASRKAGEAAAVALAMLEHGAVEIAALSGGGRNGVRV
jgi:DNA-binding FadR family transcriptional regulator